MEYGEGWAAGDTNSSACTLKGGKKEEDIAFPQTDCACHYEKPLLIAKPCAAGCVETAQPPRQQVKAGVLFLSFLFLMLNAAASQE